MASERLWIGLIALSLLIPSTGVIGQSLDSGNTLGTNTTRPHHHSPAHCDPSEPQLDRCTRWIQTFDRGILDPELVPTATGGRDTFLALDTAPSLGLTVGTGQSENPNDATDPLAVAMDTDNGTRQWTWIGEPGANGRDKVTQVEIDERRSQVLLVVEDDAPRAFKDTHVVALDAADGDRLWSTPIPEERGPRVLIDALEQGPGGHVYLAGEEEVKEGHRSQDDVFLARIDPADGSVDWTSHWDARGDDDDLVSLDIDPQTGRLYGAGLTSGFGTGPDVLVLAASPSDGDVLWTQRMTGLDPGPGLSWDWAYEVSLAPGGDRLAVTGLEERPDAPQRLTTVLSASDGAVEWRRHDPSPGSLAGGVAVGTMEDRMIVTGTVGTTALALDDGSRLWAKQFEAYHLIVGSQQGEVYATNSVNQPGTARDCITRAFATSDGQAQWTATYRGPNVGVDNEPGGNRVSDRCFELALDPARDTLLVAGDTWQPGQNADAMVLAYRQTPEDSRVPRPDAGSSREDSIPVPDPTSAPDLASRRLDQQSPVETEHGP
jgi:outer membrane protein assembly factor BamB